jgi:hypothetical protein
MIEVHPSALARLVRALAVLALPYEDQQAWLRSLGLGEPRICDELAMELADGALLSAQFVEAEWIGPDTRNLILELRGLADIDRYDFDDEFWRLESLRTSPEWERIRKVALAAILTI